MDPKYNSRRHLLWQTANMLNQIIISLLWNPNIQVEILLAAFVCHHQAVKLQLTSMSVQNHLVVSCFLDIHVKCQNEHMNS